MQQISKCSSCQREIIWTISPLGARLPLDARPVTMYTIAGYPTSGSPQAIVVKAPVVQESLFEVGDPNPKTYVSHFLTCPSWKEHKK